MPLKEKTVSVGYWVIESEKKKHFDGKYEIGRKLGKYVGFYTCFVLSSEHEYAFFYY